MILRTPYNLHSRLEMLTSLLNYSSNVQSKVSRNIGISNKDIFSYTMNLSISTH